MRWLVFLGLLTSCAADCPVAVETDNVRVIVCSEEIDPELWQSAPAMAEEFVDDIEILNLPEAERIYPLVIEVWVRQGGVLAGQYRQNGDGSIGLFLDSSEQTPEQSVLRHELLHRYEHKALRLTWDQWYAMSGSRHFLLGDFGLELTNVRPDETGCLGP